MRAAAKMHRALKRLVIEFGEENSYGLLLAREAIAEYEAADERTMRRPDEVCKPLTAPPPSNWGILA